LFQTLWSDREKLRQKEIRKKHHAWESNIIFRRMLPLLLLLLLNRLWFKYNLYCKDRLNHSVFLSLSCMYKRSIFLGREETWHKLCKSNAKLRSGIRDLERNKHQLLHRIQSIWTSLIYNTYLFVFIPRI